MDTNSRSGIDSTRSLFNFSLRSCKLTTQLAFKTFINHKEYVLKLICNHFVILGRKIALFYRT